MSKVFIASPGLLVCQLSVAGTLKSTHETRQRARCCVTLPSVADGMPCPHLSGLSPVGEARELPAAEVLVSTDICLRALEGRFRSMGLPLLINYDLPVRRVRDLILLHRKCGVWGSGPVGRLGRSRCKGEPAAHGDVPVMRTRSVHKNCCCITECDATMHIATLASRLLCRKRITGG